MSSNDEISNFHPKENNVFSLSHENIFLGRHLTVNHNISVSIAVLDSCCATIAHTPHPAYAIATPNIAEKIVPPNVEKKKRLKSIFLDTNDCCIPFIPEITIVKLITLIIGISVKSL